MRIVRRSDRSYSRARAELNRRAEPDPEIQRDVSEILKAVREQGDKAVISYVRKFGGPTLKPAQFRVTPGEIEAALEGLSGKARKAILSSRKNVHEFAMRSLRQGWFMPNGQGVIVGERFDPFERVGIYVPGGTAPLVSTAVMTCTLAKAAGVPQIVAATPAGSDGTVHAALLAALSLCGATEVYRIGGAQAIGALAFGTKTIRRVVKIFGPGNAHVVEAKRQVFGLVAVDLLPGPSEVLVIADDSANPEWIAGDLLAQSEHGRGSLALLLSNSPRILDEVAKAVTAQAEKSSRSAHLRQSLENAMLVEVADLDEAVALANEFAPEHVSIATKNAGAIAGKLTTSGAIFLGGISPVAGGDFLAGPSHELPTGGAGKSFSGLTADQFQHRTSILHFEENSLRRSLPHLLAFSEIEGLEGHGRSAAIRLKSSQTRPRRSGR